MSDKAKEPIYIIPFEYIETLILKHLVAELGIIFKTDIIIEPKRGLPKASLNQYRDQHRANAFINSLYNNYEQGKVVGLCDVDIYAQNLDFVFGLADPLAATAVVSLVRLKPSYYGMIQDDSIFCLRCVKETMHELGHLYGLEHCFRQECVMHFSRSIMDTDRKPQRFCGDCRKILQMVTDIK